MHHEIEEGRFGGGPASGVLSYCGDGSEDKPHASNLQPYWVRPYPGGTFEPLPEHEPGAVKVRLLRVHSRDQELIDIIAWAPEKPSTWWTLNDVVTHIGTDPLSHAAWTGKPAYFVETPQRFIECGKRVACVIDWTADIYGIVASCERVICETDALTRRMRETILAQNRPAIVDRITAHVRRAA
jgi:hypothetical protein